MIPGMLYRVLPFLWRHHTVDPGPFCFPSHLALILCIARKSLSSQGLGDCILGIGLDCRQPGQYQEFVVCGGIPRHEYAAFVCSESSCFISYRGDFSQCRLHFGEEVVSWPEGADELLQR